MLRLLQRITLLLAALSLVPAGTSLAVRGPHDVSRTLHNLSYVPSTELGEGWGLGYEEYATNEDEVCIFCHTPHGGDTVAPLWNRQLPDGAPANWTLYNSSTLGDVGALPAGAVGRPISSESLLCLSCHDGSIGTNRVLNASNDIGQPDNIDSPGAPQEIWWMFGKPGSRIGEEPGGDGTGTGQLQDDHPISFSYSDALADPTENELQTVGYATGRGVQFFGTDQRVECSSCHDPHVIYDMAIPNAAANGADPSYTPFLITTNDGSYLCLSCHNK